MKGPRLRGDEPKPLRMELLQTKGELERELERFLLHCRRCNRRVHRFPGQVRGHWAPFGACAGRSRIRHLLSGSPVTEAIQWDRACLPQRLRMSS